MMLHQFARPMSIPLRVILCIVVGAALGLSTLWLSPVMVTMIVGGILYLIISWSWPEIALLVILFLTSTIFDIGQIPSVSIGFGHFVATDFLLFIPLGIILLRSQVEPGFTLNHTPLDLPLLAFYAMAVLSTVVSIIQKNITFNQSLGELRALSLYLCFFIVTNLVRDEKRLRRLLYGIFALAIIVSLTMVAQYVLGDSIKILPGRVETLGTAGTEDPGVTRILPPGQSLVLVVLVVFSVIQIFDQRPSKFILRFIGLSIVGLAVLITFNRNFWVSFGLALMIVGILISERDKVNFVKLALWAIVVGVIAFTPIVTLFGSQAEKLLNGSLTRVSTLINPNILSEDSLQFREIENSYAIPQIISHPILGLGLGAQYRPRDRRLDSSGPFVLGGYIHNGHFWMMLKIGLIGYFLFLWFLVRSIKRAFENWRRIPDVFLKSVMLASAAAIAGILVGAIVNPVFRATYWASIIGVMLGANEVILMMNRPKSLDSTYKE